MLEIHWRHKPVAECSMYQTQQVQQQVQLVSIRINSVLYVSAVAETPQESSIFHLRRLVVE